MYIFQKKLNFIDLFCFSCELLDECTILCDIETTGFAAKSSNLYLIGTATRQGNTIQISQYFAENDTDETLILSSFFKVLENYTKILTFNGDGFDLRYMKDLAKKLNKSDPISNLASVDLYKLIKPYKHILKLQDLKQKTIEEFLGVYRKDCYSGGELISKYQEYLTTQDESLREEILLHNFEDILGMIHLLPITSYISSLNGNFSICSSVIEHTTDYYGAPKDLLLLTGTTKTTVPQPISYHNNGFYIHLDGSTIQLSTEIVQNKIRVPYSNYKDYYYLPNEDIAVLKELAHYVDKNERINATKSNCYGKFVINDTSIYDFEKMKNYMKAVLTYLISDSQ